MPTPDDLRDLDDVSFPEVADPPGVVVRYFLSRGTTRQPPGDSVPETGNSESGRGNVLSHVTVIVLHLDIRTDAAHATGIRTRLGWLDEKGEHGSTISELVDGLELCEDRTSQLHAPFVSLHVLRGHVRGEHKPVAGHGNPIGQDLVRKISVPCVRSGKEMAVRNTTALLPLMQQV